MKRLLITALLLVAMAAGVGCFDWTYMGRVDDCKGYVNNTWEKFFFAGNCTEHNYFGLITSCRPSLCPFLWAQIPEKERARIDKEWGR